MLWLINGDCDFNPGRPPLEVILLTTIQHCQPGLRGKSSCGLVQVWVLPRSIFLEVSFLVLTMSIYDNNHIKNIGVCVCVRLCSMYVVFKAPNTHTT